jgi:hypothetical protein
MKEFWLKCRQVFNPTVTIEQLPCTACNIPLSRYSILPTSSQHHHLNIAISVTPAHRDPVSQTYGTGNKECTIMLQLNFDAHSIPTQPGSAATVAQHWHAFGFHYISLSNRLHTGCIIIVNLSVLSSVKL